MIPTIAIANIPLTPQSYTDVGNSQRFIGQYRNKALYCHPFKSWFLWNRQVWARDESDQVRKLAKQTIIRLFQQAERESNGEAEKFAKQSLDSKRITNMLRESQADLAITPAELDQHPDLLVFENGVVDLRSGILGPHDPRHLITKMIHHGYRPDAQCPLFLRTLDRLMGGGDRAQHLMAALQRIFGYSLTGHTIEKAVFLFIGPGNNGKTLTLATLRKLLAEYATLVMIDSLMTRRPDANSKSDLADLRGARFAMTSETEAGQRLAEGQLKNLTQGMGDIKGIRKYENTIAFPATHKLFIDANHLPKVTGTDPAIWNRLFVVPFTVTIPDAEIDRALPEKLLAEAEGILSWCVTGAVEWHRDGLIRPAEVREAVREYRVEMDQLARFIAEKCVIDPGAQVTAKTLYEAYLHWADDMGEDMMSRSLFGRQLVARDGIVREKIGGDVRYLGIALDPMRQTVEVDPQAEPEKCWKAPVQ